MVGRRKHLRVKGNSKIVWSMEKGPLGEAQVSNLSISGIQFIVEKNCKIPIDSIISIKGSEEGRLSEIRKVQVKWIKEIVQEGRVCQHCGGDFI